MTIIFSSAACHLLQQPSEEDLFSKSDSSLNLFVKEGRKISPLDKRETKSITLDNKLDAFLISSKNYDKSAAAMAVGVGSIEDPLDSPGMAHFLEHMLFLGTKKYPAVDDYSDFLSANQGTSNAYTDREETNYFFEVNTDAFEGALDRFSQFFIEPLFLDEYVEREMKAVHSEHQKNLNNDNWRKHRISNLLLEKNHPQRKFSTGNHDTLGKIKKKNLLKFYEKHYSANRMKLVVISPLPINELEKLTKEKFSAVKNTNRAKHSYPEKLYDDASLPQEVSLKSIKDLRELDLSFATPSKAPYWRSKPTHLITFLVGHEAKGSLLSLLKKEGLATGLSSWFDEKSYAGQFHFKISLTEKGLKQKNTVITYFFSYIKLLKSQELPHYLYEEIRKMSDIEFVYKDHMEGGSIASYYASKLQYHPALEVEQQTELFSSYNNDHYHKYLSYIKPSKLTAIISTNSAMTDTVEEYYGAEYSKVKISKSVISEWNQAGLEESLTLPEKNNYIPETLALLKPEIADSARQILNEEDGILWFQEDSELKQPKGKISILLETPVTSSTPENKVKTILFQRALEESLNEWRYQINLAGLDFHVSYSSRGLQILFDGYSEHLPKLMKQVATKLESITIDENEFLTIKKDFIRGLENLTHEAAYQKVLYELNDLSKPGNLHYESYYSKAKNIDLISKQNLKDIKSFAKEIFQSFSIEGVAYGNLTENSVKQAALYYYDALGAKRLPSSKRQQESTYKIEDGESLALILDKQTDSPNHSWVKYLQFGKRDMKANAILRVANSVLQPDFYHELRTQKQLGYIVHSGLRFTEKALGLIFIVQSPNHDPSQIEEHFLTWQGKVIEKLEKISVFELESLKNAVSVSLREKDKTITDKYETLYFEAVLMNSTFNYKEKLADVTETITKEDVLEFFKKSLTPNQSKSLTVYLDKNDSQETREKISKSATLITDKNAYKKTRSIF